jgi:hypothetical protein
MPISYWSHLVAQFVGCSLGHGSIVTVDFAVCNQVQFSMKQLPIDTCEW